jgi:hypothetical protein
MFLFDLNFRINQLGQHLPKENDVQRRMMEVSRKTETGKLA